MAIKAPTQQLYIPRNPAEEQNHINSTLRVLRTSDGASFLSTAIPDTVVADPKKPTFTTSLADAILPTAAQSLSLLLNHPNIISLIDIVRNTSIPGDISCLNTNKWADVTVWEDMDAGSLAYLLPLSSSYPDAGDKESWNVLCAANTHRYGLPEGLVWHVLRSISRALLWLHQGIKEDVGNPGTFKTGEKDWCPVLITDISPSQIWFQHPKGKESYGSCKLGGFQRARVTGSVDAALAPRDDGVPATKQWFWAPEVRNGVTSMTRASEIWSLGATVYCMMTGVPPVGMNTYEWNVSRMNDRGYSAELRALVGDMLKDLPGERLGIRGVVDRADDLFAGWRVMEEGGRYVDVGDEGVKRAARGGKVVRQM